MSIELLPTFKTDAILAVHNHLAAAKDAKPLASWDKSKSALVARIMKMAGEDEIVAAIKATEDGPKPGTKGKVVKTAKKGKAEKKTAPAKKGKAEKKGDAKPRGQGIGAYAKECILANPEASALDIVAAVQKKFPQCNISDKSVGYYRHAMRKAGELK